MKSARHLLVLCGFLVTVIALNIATTSLGEDSSRLTIVNRTGAYLHVVVEGALYAYVAPGRILTHSTSPRQRFYVEAFYSPAQGRTAAVIDSTFTLPYSPGSTYLIGDNCTCEDPNSSAACTNDQGVVQNPAQGGSATWEITEDLFTSR